jgi:uncharacterized Zn finger protein (UPF0148 family)
MICTECECDTMVLVKNIDGDAICPTCFNKQMKEKEDQMDRLISHEKKILRQIEEF